MKSIIISVITLLIFSVSVIAQKNTAQLPGNLSTEFAVKHPGGIVENWRLKEGAYIIKFKADKKSHFDYYTLEGNWIKTETMFHFTHYLTPAVKKGWNSSAFKAWYIEEIKEVESINRHEFVFLVDNGPMLDADHVYFMEKYKLYFSPAGELIKKEELP